MCARPLLIVSLSGRALAHSARRARWQPIVVDGFADTDTQKAALCCVRLSIRDGRLDTQELLNSLQALRSVERHLPVVFGAGLESNPTMLERLAEEYIVYGNSPETVRVVNDPRIFFNLLDDLAIAHPQVRFIPPVGDGWLLKRKGSSGGGHIRLWSNSLTWGREHYFQRGISGAAMSVLFLSCGGASRIIGFSTQWVYSGDSDSPYQYAGAINQTALTGVQIRKVTAYVDRLGEALALQGLNSLDFVLVQDEPVVLELNARPSATFELYEKDLPEGLLYWHIQACQGSLPSLQRQQARRIRAHAIVYAPQALKGIPDLQWPIWSADRPASGSQVCADEPLCSVSAEGADAYSVIKLLRKRKWAMLKTLYGSRQAA